MQRVVGNVGAIMALVLGASCQMDDEDLAVGETEQQATTRGHSESGAYAARYTCAWQHIGEGTASVWANDPDCAPTAANPQGDCSANWPPNSIAGTVWGCVNWDHFTSNAFGLGSNVTLENLMMQAASYYADLYQQSGNTEHRNMALRRALDACHYAVDRNQCGHATGNIICDPHAASPSQACVDFVYANNTATDEATSIRPLAIHDGCWLAGYSNAIAYAAAERYIRHHSRQFNNCPASCPGGDSDGWAGDSCQIAGNNSNNEICRALVDQVCDEYCNPQSCAAQGKTCGPTLDGCGTVLNCGSCPEGWQCNEYGNCTQVCTALVPQCGTYYDSCGNPREAPSCPEGYQCQNNSCVYCPVENPPQCGWYQDNCGNWQHAGGCPDGFECTGGICNQVCTALVPQCGIYYDSCGHPRDAGGCPEGQQCINNSCSACTANPPQCGWYQDSCGNWYDAGGCGEGWECNNGTCTQVCYTLNPPSCGWYQDSCGNWHYAGDCPPCGDGNWDCYDDCNGAYLCYPCGDWNYDCWDDCSGDYVCYGPDCSNSHWWLDYYEHCYECGNYWCYGCNYYY
jgi:hypothetical protein